MECGKVSYAGSVHLGRKIEQVRRLLGITQTELGNLLGITKQAVSKIEHTEKLNDDRLKEVALALGVTMEGLKNYNDNTVLYSTNKFYGKCGVATNPVSNNHIFNNFSIDKAIEQFEKLLDEEKEQFELLKNEKNH